MTSATIVKVLGTKKHKNGKTYQYVLMSDNYVWMYHEGKPHGYVCSNEVWERTFHRILEG